MELSLDLSLTFAPKTISLLLGDVSRSIDTSEKLSMLEDFVQRLEVEMRKIEAFKRELPLCVILVNDAVARLKEEKFRCMGTQDEPVTEELMPPKTNSGGNGNRPLTMGKESCDKKNWMSSVQLWSTETKSKSEENVGPVPENPIQPLDKKKGSGGAFIAFNGNSRVPETVSKEVSQVPSFSLMTPASEVSHNSNSKSGCGGNSSASSLLNLELQDQPQPPPHLHQNPRKQRRCWSPELHRRFVDALQQLGGAQVATPKQIRELMQVEGLTNDEVKSHLQKYRLHVRRFPVSSVGQASNGLWMTQDQCGDKSKGNLSQSGSPQGPLTPLLIGGSVKGLSSPGRNSMDAEDEQSDCRNWKTGVHQQLEADNQSI
ncbi:transcription factor HHO5-like [Gastrolobium bilobum]|uniref:transcription factor HHO5-like n=1 Tax=Gastrolobium bilobum TaxID=150636 RepID=UPI002AB0E5D7|nr:transcription factor HHO5-like [Gastrolobium bilobum]